MRRALGTAVALIATEYLLLVAAIDVAELRFLREVPGLVDSVKRIGPLAVCVVTALLLLGGRKLREAWDGSVPPSLRERPLLLSGHLAAYAAFLGLTIALARERLPAGTFSVSAWVALGVACAASLVLLITPHRMWAWVKSAGLSISLGALAVGVLSLLAGVLANRAWQHLATAAIWLSSRLLAFSGHEVLVDYDPPSLQVGNFQAFIEAPCSGLEGMGLMLVLIGAYLFAFRSELRFPAALALLPAGVAIAFVANAVRIAALMLVGSKISVHLANGGFHSKAGWVVFCCAAVGLIYASRKLLSREPRADAAPATPLVAGDLAAYIAPELCLLGTALLTGLVAAGTDRLMALRFVVAAFALAKLSRPLLTELRVSVPALIVGVLVYLLWIALVQQSPHDAPYQAFLAELGALEATLFLGARVVGSVVIVPMAEELAFRGFLARWPMSAQFERVAPRSISAFAVVLSSTVFGLLHSEVVAGVCAGLAYCLLYRKTERLSDAIVAHAITNALIAAEVLLLGHYGRW